MLAYIFPGQGSQAKGMGATLFQEFPEHVQKADAILGYSIADLCLHDENNQLANTIYTQPAMYTLNCLSYIKKIYATGVEPDYVAGHSLGEYCALFAAGVFDFATGLKLVQKRAALMGEVKNGAMAAVLGLKSQEVQTILDSQPFKNINIANYNTYTQNVVSGAKADVLAAESVFIQSKATYYVPLPVSGAFHSPYMQEAKQRYADFLQKIAFLPPSIPVIANVNAQPYAANEIADKLIEQITTPVMWVQTIEFMYAQGVSNIEEIGPGKVLSSMLERMRNGQ